MVGDGKQVSADGASPVAVRRLGETDSLHQPPPVKGGRAAARQTRKDRKRDAARPVPFIPSFAGPLADGRGGRRLSSLVATKKESSGTASEHCTTLVAKLVIERQNPLGAHDVLCARRRWSSFAGWQRRAAQQHVQDGLPFSRPRFGRRGQANVTTNCV